MAVRVLEGETWDRVVGRVRTHAGPVTVAWAILVGSESTETDVLALSIRGGHHPSVAHYYDRLEIHSERRDPSEVAEQLQSGKIATGRVEFTPPDSGLAGVAYWVGRDSDYGRTARIDRPSYYFSYPVFGQLFSSSPVQRARLDSPLSAPGQAYWPRGSDAVLEVVYGVSRHQGRRDISPELIIHLPYLGPHMTGVEWIEGLGLVATIEGPSPIPPGFDMHFLWTVQPEEHQLRRHVAHVLDGVVATPVASAPVWFNIALTDPTGSVIDSVEGSFRSESPAGDGEGLPPEALLEAFDFFASVWRNAFGAPLFGAQRQLTPLASLMLPVATRSDFESRLSQLDALLKSLQVGDDLLDLMAPVTTRDQTLNRLESAFKKRFGESSPEFRSAANSLQPLRRLNDLRNAVQHPGTKRGKDLPSALAALGLGYPPSWARDWDRLRSLVRLCIVDLRSLLQASL